jgi:hypothetical protein
MRRTLGFRSAQNFENYHWAEHGMTSAVRFFNHISASRVKAVIPPEIWASYKKVTIVRNPFDVAISRYYWKGGEDTGMDFSDFLRSSPQSLNENAEIAPAAGPSSLDTYLRYERIEQDMRNNGLEFLWSTFSGIMAKGHTRPKGGASIHDIYARYPEAVALIRAQCAGEIARWGYTL